MLINLHNLTHLPVFTQSGDKLGRVRDLNIDIESHCIKSYIVRAHTLLGQPYLVKPTQIVEITAEKIVVEDAVIRAEESQTEDKVKSEALAGIAMSNED